LLAGASGRTFVEQRADGSSVVDLRGLGGRHVTSLGAARVGRFGHPMTRHEPRLLIYSQDGLGLGHLRRTTLLATELLRTLPGASALTVSDSPLGQFFATAPGHDYLKLPSIRKAGPGDWQAVKLSSSFPDVLAMRRQLIASAIDSFKPDVVLVDHMPHGAMGELVPALERLRDRPVRVLLGLRDILDAPDVIRHRWRVEGAYDAVHEYYDQVLVYGSRDVFDVSRQYEWPDPIADRLHYCGYVCADPPAATSRAIRTRYLGRGSRDRLVLVMAGGGADAYPLYDALLEAAPGLHAHARAHLLMVTGPFMPTTQRRALARRARGLQVTLVRTVADAPAYMTAADLVVAMAGYNTTTEILSTGRDAVLVPRKGPSAEQQTRARLFAERGWVRWLPPQELDAASIAAAVTGALTGPGRRRPRTGPDLRGREVAARYLHGVLRAAVPAPRTSPEQADGVRDRVVPRLLGIQA
jgi:predicted glycosyltransferase